MDKYFKYSYDKKEVLRSDLDEVVKTETRWVDRYLPNIEELQYSVLGDCETILFFERLFTEDTMYNIKTHFSSVFCHNFNIKPGEGDVDSYYEEKSVRDYSISPCVLCKRYKMTGKEEEYEIIGVFSNPVEAISSIMFELVKGLQLLISQTSNFLTPKKEKEEKPEQEPSNNTEEVLPDDNTTVEVVEKKEVPKENPTEEEPLIAPESKYQPKMSLFRRLRKD